jgi:hypothetical protein
MASKVMTGARALVMLTNPNTNRSSIVGSFHTVTWGLNFDVQPINILGRFSPAELCYTAQEAVNVQCVGFKVIGNGAHRMMGMPNTRELLTHEYLSLSIKDRQSGEDICRVHSLRPVSYSTTLNARNVEDISVSYMGLLVDAPDEGVELAESPGAATLP